MGKKKKRGNEKKEKHLNLKCNKIPNNVNKK